MFGLAKTDSYNYIGTRGQIYFKKSISLLCTWKDKEKCLNVVSYLRVSLIMTEYPQAAELLVSFS